MPELTQIKQSDIVPAPRSLADQLAMKLLDSADISTDTLREVLKMQNEQEDRRRNQEIEDRQWASKLAFNESFVKCKSEMPQIAKEARNNQTNSDYAEMEAIDLAITPVMTKHGFAITFSNGEDPKDDDHLHIIATLVHSKGFEKHYDDQVPIAGIGAKGNRMMTHTHGHGATKTYARRYLKLDIWDLALMKKDSDGNANNVSELAESYLIEIENAKDRKALENISAKISTDVSLNGPSLARVRKAWAANLKRVG